MRTLPKELFVAALVCYVTAFFLPTFGIGDKGQVEVHNGLDAFEASFLAPMIPVLGDRGLIAFVVWLANPAFWLAAVLFVRGSRRGALAASVVAIVSSCWLMFAPLVFIGYFFWQLSQVLMAAACATALARPRQAVVA